MEKFAKDACGIASFVLGTAVFIAVHSWLFVA
jgi:hypothetical protein